ncbi:MAG: FAD/NAD(P)-binding protein [Planctomycetaceae bacterium]|nr:FAD/NAD(P)-binding protein [Planctomycetaceae bacterium]
MNVSSNNTPPVSPWTTRPLVLQSRRPETPGVETFEFAEATSGIATGALGLPGQFNMLYVPGYGEAAISLSAPADNSGRHLHTIRTVGNVTQALFRLQPGEMVGCRGPFGTGWPLEACRENEVVMIGGGIGLAPLRSLIGWFRANPTGHRVSVLLGARSPEHLLYQPEYRDWEASGIQVHCTVDRATPSWQGHVGVVLTLMDRLSLPNPRNTIVLICGPEIMMRYSALEALERGIPADRIWLSIERHMNCAVGLCGRCQWGSHLICARGPVLRYDQLVHQWNVPAL